MNYPEIPLGKLANDNSAFVDGPFGSNLKASEYVDSGVPIMRLQNIRPNEYVPKDVKYISKAKADSLSRHSYKSGDVVIAKLGAVGTACIVPSHCEDGVIVVDVVRFRGDLNKIDHNYLSLFLNSPEGQKRIAHLLGKVEGLIAQRKQHLQQLDDLLKSIFLEMFGDPVRNEKNHKISPLAPYITHLTSGGRGWAKYYAPSGKRFIRSLDVQMNAIGSDDVVYVTPPNNKETERTRVLPGDVLLTITGSKIGRVCFVPQDFEEAYISQHVAIIRTNGWPRSPGHDYTMRHVVAVFR